VLGNLGGIKGIFRILASVSVSGILRRSSGIIFWVYVSQVLDSPELSLLGSMFSIQGLALMFSSFGIEQYSYKYSIKGTINFHKEFIIITTFVASILVLTLSLIFCIPPIYIALMCLTVPIVRLASIEQNILIGSSQYDTLLRLSTISSLLRILSVMLLAPLLRILGVYISSLLFFAPYAALFFVKHRRIATMGNYSKASKKIFPDEIKEASSIWLFSLLETYSIKISVPLLYRLSMFDYAAILTIVLNISDTLQQLFYNNLVALLGEKEKKKISYFGLMRIMKVFCLIMSFSTPVLGYAFSFVFRVGLMSYFILSFTIFMLIQLSHLLKDYYVIQAYFEGRFKLKDCLWILPLEYIPIFLVVVLGDYNLFLLSVFSCGLLADLIAVRKLSGSSAEYKELCPCWGVSAFIALSMLLIFITL
jgi:hypothetical protein